MKKLLAPALHSLALATGVSARRARALAVGRIITFHGVGDDSYPAPIFEAHLRYLAGHFSVVSLATLVDRMNSPRGLTDEIVLTFDDGLRNNFTTAYPILNKLGLPATFFVCPGLVGTGQWLWTHEVRARLAGWPAESRSGWFERGPGAGDEQILEQLKQLGLKERNAVEEQLRRLTAGFSPTPSLRQCYDLMNWDELGRLDPAFITIGSHSLTHPVLSTLTRTELVVEVVESRRMLENILQRRVEFFCYPNGSHNPEVVRLATETYRAAFATDPGFVRAGCPLHQLPRIGIAPGLAYLAWRLHRPGA
jgi:peptidoglycan/xylan/chitin deacetylase (PgdA/CDA1 family)